MGNEQADTGRDARTHLSRPYSQAQTGTGIFFPVQLTMNRIGNLTRLIHTLVSVMTIHTYINLEGEDVPLQSEHTTSMILHKKKGRTEGGS